MSRIKTIICAASFGLFWTGPLQAQSGLSQVFAECVGRFSAEREHAWLVGAQDADILDAQRETFLALLDASHHKTHPNPILSYRIEVKVAHASLLTLATFGSDIRRAKRAKQLAAHYLNTCQNLLLDS